MTETRFINCGDAYYTVVSYSDGTVAILDSTGVVVAGWPATAKLTALEARAMSDAELCQRVRAIGKTRPDPS